MLCGLGIDVSGALGVQEIAIYALCGRQKI